MLLNKKLKFICFFLSLLLLGGPAYASPDDELNSLQDVLVENRADGLHVRLTFQRALMYHQAPVFYKKSAQMDFPNAQINPGAKYFPVSGFIVSQIYASQFEPKTLRIRFMLDGRDPDLEKKFKWEVSGRFLDIKIMKRADSHLDRLMDRARSHKRKKNKIAAKPNDPVVYAETLKSEEPLAAAEMTGLQKRSASARDPSPVPVKKENKLPAPHKTEDAANLLDERIAIFDKKNSGQKTGAGDNLKPVYADTLNLRPASVKMLYMSLAALGMIFSILYLFKKFVWLGKRNGGTGKTVNVLSIGYLGPKKSVALIEVAGEVLVLGIASDNISLLANIKDEEKIAQIKNPECPGYTAPDANQKIDRYRSVKSSAVAEKKTVADHPQEFSGTDNENKYSSSDVAMMIRKNLQKMGAAP